MIWKVILWRITSLIFSWIFVIINGIIRDSKETREEAQKIEEIYGKKRTLLLNVYTFVLIPELIVIGLIIHDIKIILNIER